MSARTKNVQVRITRGLFAKRADKKKLRGIHGTLFYQLDFKKELYPTKREADLD